jgi:hypothetical protein
MVSTTATNPTKWTALRSEIEAAARPAAARAFIARCTAVSVPLQLAARANYEA